MLTHAWIIPLIPALSFLLILAVGKKLPRGGSEIGLASVAICFVLALAVGIGWIGRVNHPPEAGGLAKHVAAVVAENEHSLAASSPDSGTAAAHGTEGTAEAGHGAEATTEEAGHGTEATAEGEGHEAAGEEEHHVTEPVIREITWFQNGGVKINVGTMIDGLSALMLVVVTLISMLVHVFSTDYVAGDRRYTHYFAFLSLFTASMLFFVLADNTLQMIVGWELVGLCSFGLIGHWWEEKPNSDAALKAFLTNRVGDIGLLCGVIILYFAAGRTFDTVTINTLANEGEIRHFLLLVASLSLMTAVMSKSGQFVLHTWLPDAMAGPTPVSALIHAATMVVAGVFMIARLYGVFFNGFSIGTGTLNPMAVVGAVTLIGAGLLAFVQSDIKKVLAYSTVSQLGYMVMALGVGGWTAGIFHLFTHALFKACLFLGAGSLAHHIHSFDMKKDMGGLRKVMPKTFWTFMIGTAALVAFPFTSGFWSKDEILASSQQLGGGGGYKFMLIAGTAGAALTGAYMTRAIWYVFFGERRGASATHDMHENGPRITVPLIILSVGALFAGFTNIPEGTIFPKAWTLRFEHFVEPTGSYFPGELPSFAHPEFNIWVAVISTAVGLLGILLAYLWFFKQKGPHGITERNKVARGGFKVLENKYGLDILYTDIIAGGFKGPIAKGAYWFNQNVIDGLVNLVASTARTTGAWVYKNIDQGVVDNVVKGSGLAAEGSGEVLRKTQTGKVQAYGAYLFLGAAVLAALLVVLAS
ncbi:NADH-quinone oxidoreductase subunit L [Aquihabitans sp. G128]|uniref:NADH-quinone oxidoreductase subunit 5 family protein n=1 Tax=Aquihabitans sp. G128 TaxID=2849779 RepID=UPI001C22F486|nr:NADH-quinone oxidoreductase subunit L [Aquihabitans sp. G128]QXC60191.1 NADH-quinone oxidoreductase subunit L [Aquihabitans sp. G128]